MSVNRKIFRAIVIIGSLTLVSKLGSAAKELVVARWFGRADSVDALLIALLPSVLVNLIAYAVSFAVVPVFVRVRNESGKEAARELLSGAMLLTCALLAALTLLLGLLSPYYLPLASSGFSSSKLLLTRKLLYLLLPFTFFGALSMIWSALVNVYENFALPAWSPVLIPLASVVFLIFGGNRWGIFAFAIGMVFGQILQCALLAWKLSEYRILVPLRWTGMTSELRQCVKQYWGGVPAAFLIGGIGFVDQSMAAMLAPGSVAALGYGMRLVALANGLGAAALATAVFPYFSSLASQGDHQYLRHTVNTYVVLCIWVGTVAGSFLCLFSRPLTGFLFERGAFTASDTTLVSQVSSFYSLQIPFYMICIIGSRLLSTLSLNQYLGVIALLNFISNLTLNYLFMKLFGVAGIALSTTVVYVFSSVAVFALLSREAGISLEGKTVVHIIAAGTAALISVGCVIWSSNQFPKALSVWLLVSSAALVALSRRFTYKQVLSSLSSLITEGGRA
jgi:putative peptidoglycan lipid II flippase